MSQRPVAPELPGAWIKAGRRVINYTSAYFVLVLVALVDLVLLVAGPKTDGIGAGTLRPGYVVGLIALVAVSLTVLVCFFGLIVSAGFWLWGAHRLTPTGAGPLGYGGLAGFLALSVAGILWHPHGLALIIEAVLGLAQPFLLIGGVIASRTWVAGRVSAGHREAMQTVPPRGLTAAADDWDTTNWDPDLEREIAEKRNTV